MRLILNDMINQFSDKPDVMEWLGPDGTSQVERRATIDAKLRLYDWSLGGDNMILHIRM